MTDDPAATLYALADDWRDSDDPVWVALAELFYEIAKHGHHEAETCMLYVTEMAVAVADAAGIKAPS